MKTTKEKTWSRVLALALSIILCTSFSGKAMADNARISKASAYYSVDLAALDYNSSSKLLRMYTLSYSVDWGNGYHAPAVLFDPISNCVYLHFKVRIDADGVVGDSEMTWCVYCHDQEADTWLAGEEFACENKESAWAVWSSTTPKTIDSVAIVPAETADSIEKVNVVFSLPQADLCFSDQASATAFLESMEELDKKGNEFMPDENAVIDNPFADAQKGDIVLFGNYEQNNRTSDGQEPIEWIVLDEEDGELLLLSKYCLDSRAYNRKADVSLVWENSDYRAWLNDDFYNTAFSEEEKALIVESYHENPTNPKYGTKDGHATWDNVFALSIEEAIDYLGTKGVAEPTAYAKAQGIQVYESRNLSWWWLRSLGKDHANAATVWTSGAVGKDGKNVVNEVGGVRPCIWVSVEEYAVLAAG